MRQVIIFAAAALIIGSYAARFADTASKDSPRVLAAAAAARAYEPREPVHSGRNLTVDAGRDGHFKVEARIFGQDLDFMVDTGASQVIIRESDAARIGIHPLRSEFTAAVSTANGRINAAPAMLDRIEVGGITVYDVHALVLPDAALWRNLLGMSFLSKLKRYEVANGRLVLED